MFYSRKKYYYFCFYFLFVLIIIKCLTILFYFLFSNYIKFRNKNWKEYDTFIIINKNRKQKRNLFFQNFSKPKTVVGEFAGQYSSSWGGGRAPRTSSHVVPKGGNQPSPNIFIWTYGSYIIICIYEASALLPFNQII